jgi:hypothetical protein
MKRLPGWLRALLRAVPPILGRATIFILIGPAIGGIAVLVMGMLIAGDDSQSAGIVVSLLARIFVGLVMLPFVVIASYLLGGLAAIVGGLVAAIVSPWIPNLPLRVACAAVIGAAAAVICRLDVTHDPGIPDAALAVAGAVSATICSSIVELIARELRDGAAERLAGPGVH